MTGNGWLLTLTEWVARTYRWPLQEVLAMPALQIALLYRQWAVAVADYKGNSLIEDLFFG